MKGSHVQASSQQTDEHHQANKTTNQFELVIPQETFDFSQALRVGIHKVQLPIRKLVFTRWILRIIAILLETFCAHI